MGDALVEFMGEPGEMMFLAVVACHAILAAADGYADMSHDQVSLRRTLSTRPSRQLHSALIGSMMSRITPIASSRRRAASRLVVSSAREWACILSSRPRAATGPC